MVAYFQCFEQTLTHISRTRQYSSRIYGEERFSNGRWHFCNLQYDTWLCLFFVCKLRWA